MQGAGGGPNIGSKSLQGFVPFSFFVAAVLLISWQLFVEPIREEILPPRPQGQYPPYVLLISLDDLLVTSTWDVSDKYHIVRIFNLGCSVNMDGERQSDLGLITSWAICLTGMRSSFSRLNRNMYVEKNFF